MKEIEGISNRRELVKAKLEDFTSDETSSESSNDENQPPKQGRVIYVKRRVRPSPVEALKNATAGSLLPQPRQPGITPNSQFAGATTSLLPPPPRQFAALSQQRYEQTSAYGRMRQLTSGLRDLEGGSHSRGVTDARRYLPISGQMLQQKWSMHMRARVGA